MFITIKKATVKTAVFKTLSNQQGIGLIEVLVALLILAIGVSGFALVQMNATKQTDEALTRTQATTLLRETAERMRSNQLSLADYKAAMDATSIPALSNCTSCTPANIANDDVNYLKTLAQGYGISLGMQACSSTDTLSRSCLIAAWDSTTATVGAASSGNVIDCISDDGVYHKNSHCLVMEAY